MTPEKQRIAIAEACGWRWYRRLATGPWAHKPMRTLYHPLIFPEDVALLTAADMTERECNAEFMWREGMVPDYPHDLNAMHEAEEYLRATDLGSWALLDAHMLGKWNATAAQRAEAFLRTIGKWEDGE